MLEGNNKPSPKIEINFVVRDKNGKPTGQRKSFAADEANEVASFYNRHQQKSKRRRGSKGKGKGYGGRGKSNGKTK